uniref:NADH-ubiquinone oxidoreductase chain 5 n=1 Tax=Sinentomon erythranum TaxID=289455 RepID=G3D5N5_9HEXA|nr:NADH dehydrogenase subunit 5 [Sinentomon erythranum]ADN32962.1 NADH dehydrogenase subunit 5 [Sinentomon erythranum]
MIKSMYMIMASTMMMMISMWNSNSKTMMMEYEMLNMNSMNMTLTMMVDWTSTMFSSTVMFITSMILLYSNYYMKEDPNMKRFKYILTMFSMSMIMLIMTPNMFSLLLGWDMLGITSFCLVAYYQNWKSFNSSMITILMNRMGDAMLMITVSYIMMKSKMNMSLNKMMNPNMITTLITLAAFMKSAQIPFSAWLPEAMAAPTPVSALVHSSTLVTAGVYLMIRFYPNQTEMKMMIMNISLMTMIMSSISACLEMDMKKIIALSTLSQLSYMMLNLNMNKTLTTTHMMTHAMFKSLLFMSAGVFIHSNNSSQDLRKSTSTQMNMPMSNTSMTLSIMSLCGMPFMAGFYSKDMMIETMMMSNMSNTMSIIPILSANLTLFYSLRMLNMMKKMKNTQSMEEKTYSTPMTTLSITSIASGSYISWMLNLNSKMFLMNKMEKMMLPMMMMMLLMMMKTTKYMKMKKTHKMMFIHFMSTKSTMSKYLMMNTKMNLSNWMESSGPQGIYKTSKKNSKNMEKWKISTMKTMISSLMIMMLM